MMSLSEYKGNLVAAGKADPTTGAVKPAVSTSTPTDFKAKVEALRQSKIQQRNAPPTASELDVKSARDTGASAPYETGVDTGGTAGLKAAANVPSSALNLGKNLFTAATHPINTLTGVERAVEGGIQQGMNKLGVNKMIGGEDAKPVVTPETQTFDALANAMKERYGSVDNAARTATNDPMGFGADVLAVLSGGASALGKLGTVSKGIETVGGAGRDVATFVPKKIAGAVADEVKTGLVNPVKENIKSGVQDSDMALSLSRKNVAPQLESSALRLNERAKKPPVAGIASERGALDTYEEFYKAAEGHMKDDKVARPIDQFIVPRTVKAIETKVTPQLKAAGETMGAEMKKIGGTKVDITPTFETLEKDLFDRASLVFDAEKGKVIDVPGVKQSALDATDRAFAENYIKELNDLGANPTARDLANFEKRNRTVVNKALQDGKIDRNVAAIVKKHASSLLDELKADANPAFKTYAEARAKYRELSNFLEEADTRLGDDSVLGNPTKLNSTLKSAMVSLHGTGNKDWLLKLEQLTGYNSVDEARLALQAMKDAGDVQGASLLEKLFSESNLPKTGYEAATLGIKTLWGKAKEGVLGSPAEQTRRVLKSLEAPQP